MSPSFIYKIKTLPTSAIDENGINYSKLDDVDEDLKFVKVPSEILFKAPNVIIWENIGKKKFPIFYNETSFSFKHRIIGIYSTKNNTAFLKRVVQSFERKSDFYRFYFLATSSETLINRNNTFLLKDIKNVPFVENDFLFSKFDINVINDSLGLLQDFLIRGEKSKALESINGNKNFDEVMNTYGSEFSRALNSIYEDNERKFRLSDVVQLENSLIATVFKYDSENIEPKFCKDLHELNIDGLTNNEISTYLSVNRIIKLYPQKDTIVFIKPNQYRYWISLIAYRDADKCFSDFSNLPE